MKTRYARVVAGLAAIVAASLLLHFLPFQTTASAIGSARPPAQAEPILLAAPGRLEGRTETVEVGASVDGIIASVLVSEGQRVGLGDVVATLSCSDLQTAREVVI